MKPLIVTLDGPAGSGKSTVARKLAQRLGVEFLDTGAMYRGLTAAAVDRGIDPADDPDAVVDLARHAIVEFDWGHDPPRLTIDGEDITHRLRAQDVTDSVSEVASMHDVREMLVEAQRRIGRDHPRLVTEGRDQGSVVFPHAQVKFSLDAAPQVRAHRRAEQLREAGEPADEAKILESIRQRDRRDSQRQDGPLICPDDAIRVDTSDMSLEQVVDHLFERVTEQVGPVASAPSEEAS